MTIGSASITRNARCPCGSGRRYKDCCGSANLGRPRALSATMLETMQQATVFQMNAQFSDAKSLYERAVEECPDSADAFNMLALVEYSLGNLDRAAVVAAEAARLAPNAAAVRNNRAIIEGARRVRTYRSRIFDPQADQHPPAVEHEPLVHIYKIAGNVAGGTEWRGIELARRLRNEANVVLWTENPSLGEIFTREHEIRLVDSSHGTVPEGGTLVVEGSYHRVGTWYEKATYRRVVLLCNIVDPLGIAAVLEQLCVPGKPKVELVFASEWLQRSTGLPGHFEPSPIDTDLFSPVPVADPLIRGNPGSFVVGRLSRDDPMKHHAGAPEFYRQLVAEGLQVRLMGAMPLEANLRGVGAIEILPQGTIPARDFLRSLDCFIYRTNAACTEAWGRVVTEAMATGLPVVVHANGGYTQLLHHGENGFLFHRDDEAVGHVCSLASSPRLRDSMGAAARKTILDLLSDAAFRKYSDFYLK
jgi:glycosyltransferase involved in cell wall biosynthesis